MLNRQAYLVKEHVGFLKIADTFDILDPETQQQIGVAKERPSALVQILRLFIGKKLLPTEIVVYEGTDADNESRRLFSLRRGLVFIRGKVDILDEKGTLLGSMTSRFVVLGAAFTVRDASGNEVAEIKGDWKGRNFRFLDLQGNEIGMISQQWAGLAREFFTSADRYVISLSGQPSAGKAILLLAAGLAVDTVFKEHE